MWELSAGFDSESLGNQDEKQLCSGIEFSLFWKKTNHTGVLGEEKQVPSLNSKGVSSPKDVVGKLSERSLCKCSRG